MVKSRNAELRHGTLLTVKAMMEDSKYGRSTVMKIADEANAIVKVGHTVRINPTKFYSYIGVEYMN